MRTPVFVSLALTAALGALPTAPLAQDPAMAASVREGGWDAEAVSLLERLPVQDEGRVKPLHTFASYLLLRVRGMRTQPTETGERLSAMEWLLDCLFYPDRARTYRTFVVPNSEVLDAIGLSHIIRKKRDRYSFQELLPGLQRLYELANQYLEIDSKKRNLVQNQVLTLRRNIHDFTLLTRYLDAARHNFSVPASRTLTKAFGGRESVSFADVLKGAPTLMHVLRTLYQEGLPEGIEEAVLTQERAAIEQLLTDFRGVGETGQWLALFPPAASQPPESAWLAPVDLTTAALRDAMLTDGHGEMMAALETMARSLGDREAFVGAAQELHRRASALAGARGEYHRIGLEVTYHKADFFGKSLMGYVAAFLILAVSWLRPRGRWLVRAGAIVIGIGTLPLLVGIVVRCIVRSRPPITGLYDTILFITAVCVIVALVIELIHRRRIALPVAAFLGIAGMFMAGRYEAGQGTDTMPRLVAVLDTNFWLWTHVTTVTTGYAAGLLAGLLGHVYILGRLLGLRRGDRPFYSHLARMAYGVLCFGLFFSVVGTILGGIWANDSWGRFWGWDPKENGALMICLWGIAVLHGRMGGYVRDLGMAVSSVVMGGIVVFSWWGVNMLGVGLHSYGFTEGMAALYWFYGFELMVLLAAAGVYLQARARTGAPTRQA